GHIRRPRGHHRTFARAALTRADVSPSDRSRNHVSAERAQRLLERFARERFIDERIDTLLAGLPALVGAEKTTDENKADIRAVNTRLPQHVEPREVRHRQVA